MAQKVLIVEDDGNIAELLHLYLEKEGFETKVAKDGGKGVEYFRSFQPDLVLLDIMLPIMDGWTVLKKIREDGSTPVIMLTAKGEKIDIGNVIGRIIIKKIYGILDSHIQIIHLGI